MSEDLIPNDDAIIENVITKKFIGRLENYSAGEEIIIHSSEIMHDMRNAYTADMQNILLEAFQTVRQSHPDLVYTGYGMDGNWKYWTFLILPINEKTIDDVNKIITNIQRTLDDLKRSLKPLKIVSSE